MTLIALKRQVNFACSTSGSMRCSATNGGSNEAIGLSTKNSYRRGTSLMARTKTTGYILIAKFMEEQRGSEKLLRRLFGADGDVSHESLHESVSAAREVFQIRRWIVIGQPTPDQILAMLDIELGMAGRIIQEIVNLQSPKLSINCHVFPMGQPKPDVVQVQVDAQINIRR